MLSRFRDTATLGVSMYLERLSERGQTEKMTFGFKRYSVLAALLTALILLGGSTYILYEGVQRLFQPEAVKPMWMLVISIFGIGINGLAVLRLKGGNKLNERVVFLHLLEDVLGWAAVFGVSIVMLFVNLRHKKNGPKAKAKGPVPAKNRYNYILNFLKFSRILSISVSQSSISCSCSFSSFRICTAI
ncbi:MAG: cation transporter [Spirochaetia bacterium]